MQRVHDELEALGPEASRNAHFVCALAVCWPGRASEWFEGRVDGTLVWPPRGDNGFGYDAMFQPIGYDQTFGEMDPAEKHAMSHRADAFRKLVAALMNALRHSSRAKSRGAAPACPASTSIPQGTNAPLAMTGRGEDRARPLHPLAVLRLQMPLLRLQQPRPRGVDQERSGARRCSPTSP
jgi:hypothetical protein